MIGPGAEQTGRTIGLAARSAWLPNGAAAERPGRESAEADSRGSHSPANSAPASRSRSCSPRNTAAERAPGQSRGSSRAGSPGSA